MITGIRHVGFGCASIKRTQDFYRRLGFKEIWNEIEDAAYMGEIWGIKNQWVTTLKFQAPDGSVTEGLHVYPWMSHINFNHIALITDDIQKEYANLAEYFFFISPPVVSPGGKSKVCIFFDPEGNPIELVEILKEWNK